jgi:magnesium chelatase accessory protein
VSVSWERDGRDWPHREASRFVTAAGWRWHLQQMGAGPPLVLLHGTGAASHSWRGLLPLLARQFTVVAPDLPGHGFTDMPAGRRLSLPAMAAAVRDLLQALHVEPDWLVGHSAGAAIAARMALDGPARPRGIVALNGAMLPIRGLLGLVFSAGARLFNHVPFMTQLMVWHVSRPGTAARLMRDTGSVLDPAGMDLYARLARDPAHVAAVFDMMSAWDVVPLERDLPRLACRLLLVNGARDGMVPPATAQRIARLVPRAEAVVLPGLGHLAHEEAPELVAQRIVGFTAAGAQHAA